MADSPEDFLNMFRDAGKAIGENLRRSWYESIAQGKRIYLSDRPGSLESKVQAAFDRNPNLPREELERVIAEHLAGQARKGQQPANPTPPQTSPVWSGMPPKNPLPPLPWPPPPNTSSPAPLPPPNLTAAGPAPQQAPPQGSPSGYTPPPVQAPRPTPATGTFPASMFGQTPPPPQNSYSYFSPTAQVFPRGMFQAIQPPPPPPPPPNFFQNYGQHFNATVARQAHYGYVDMGHAAKAAFTAAAPEVAIPLQIASAFGKEMKESVKNLHEFARTTIEANRALSVYSPALSTAFASFALSEYKRNSSLANYSAQSGVGALKAWDSMRDSFHPFQVAQQGLANSGTSFVAGAFKGGADELRAIPEILEFLRGALDPQGSFVAGAGEAIGKVAGTVIAAAMIPGAGVMAPLLIKFLKKQLDAPDIKPGAPVMGSWDVFGKTMFDQAGGKNP